MWREAAIPRVSKKHCTGCGRCVAACRLHLLSLEVAGWIKFSALHDGDRCTACGACTDACPFNAIALQRTALLRIAVADPETL